MALGTDALADGLLRRLRRLGQAERRRIAASYFPTAMEVYGVPVPDLRRVATELGCELAASPPREVVALCRTLAACGVMEGRQAAYEILVRHRPAAATLSPRDVELLGRGNDNWGSVDAFSCLVAGPAWREGRLGDATIWRWARSPDRWWRRTALVSTVVLNARSRGGDPARTLDVCRRLAGDRDETVAKALSWALRELSKRDPEAVRGFVEEHAEELAARVLREVRSKLETGLKNPRST